MNTICELCEELSDAASELKDLFQKSTAVGLVDVPAGATITLPSIVCLKAGYPVSYSSGDWVMFTAGVPSSVIAPRSVSGASVSAIDYVGQVILMYVGTLAALPPIVGTTKWDWVVGANYYHGTALAAHTHANINPGVATSFTPGFYEFDYTCQAGKDLGIAVEGTASSSTGRLWSKGSSYTTNASGAPAALSTQVLFTGPRHIDLSAAYGKVHAGTSAVDAGDVINIDNVVYGTGTFSGNLTVTIG